MINVTGNFSDDMRKYVVTVPPLLTTVEGVEITLPAVVFEFDTGSTTTPADVVDALQSYVGKCSPASTTYANHLCLWLRRNILFQEGITLAFERALKTASDSPSLGSHVASVTGLGFSYKLNNELRLEWARHCITALLNLPSLRNKEMNEKHNHELLRPVKFDELSLDDKLVTKDSSLTAVCSVVYKGSNFVVVKYKDGSDTVCTRHALSRDFTLAPLCWVEGKPVYPGDGPLYYKHGLLYYKHGPRWKYNVESVTAFSISDDELHFHGGIAFPISDATWTKPETKRVPSFQVEGQDVYPGDTVYYYGDDKHSWGQELAVEKDGFVNGVHADSFSKGTATFRLKPQLVIGDQLVPMPECEAPAEGTTYYTPDPHSVDHYGSYIWRNLESDQRFLVRGLIHLTKEAAIAHGQALVALSKKKKD